MIEIDSFSSPSSSSCLTLVMYTPVSLTSKQFLNYFKMTPFLVERIIGDKAGKPMAKGWCVMGMGRKQKWVGSFCQPTQKPRVP